MTRVSALLRGQEAPAIQGAPKHYSGKETLQLRALGRGNIEVFHTGGWWGGPKPNSDMRVVDNVFEAFAAPDSTWTADDLVYMDFGSERLYNRHGEPLPVAVRFDYIGGRICESTYDLKALLALLQARPDIRPLDPKADQLTIMNIPYYNAEEGHTRSIEFMWVPTVEDYRRVVAAVHRPYGSLREAFFQVDIAGLAPTRRICKEEAEHEDL